MRTEPLSYAILLFGAKLLKKNETSECSLRKISYFCIVKRNICLFKSFFVCFLALFMAVGDVAAQESVTVRDDASLDSVEVFLLTCQPHDEVYSLYGHTSIRVFDKNTGGDYAVNFGVFDSTADYFALRFAFGLTDYMMAIYDFRDFLDEYRFYGSGVYQQHINMSREEKRNFLKALYETSRPENVVYRYNFLYNNCTTKARDIITGALSGEVEYQTTSLQKGERTFRQLIHLKNEDSRWARVGNDLLLGVGADAVADHGGRQFLPEVLMNDFDSASVLLPDGTKKVLVDEAGWVLLPGTPYHPDNAFGCPLSPKTMAILFFCAILSLCLVEMLLLKRRLLWMDYCVVILYGVVGVVLGAMIFSAHPTVNLNLQILLFNPLYLFFMYPRLRFKWRWHLMLLSIALFFMGNAVQSYAEGANIMAFALLVYALNGFAADNYGYLMRKK